MMTRAVGLISKSAKRFVLLCLGDIVSHKVYYEGFDWENGRNPLESNPAGVKRQRVALIAFGGCSLRLLLCAATDTTPHERFSNFQRRSCTGESLPSWLTRTRTAYLKRFVCASWNDPLVDEAEFVNVRPTYARVPYPGGREVTVRLRYLAPCPQVRIVELVRLMWIRVPGVILDTFR